MASQQIADTTEIYFISEEQAMKALRQRASDLEKVEEEPEYGEVITDAIDPVYSNLPHTEYCEYNDIEDEYVLPQTSQTTIKSKSDVTARPTTKRDVEDLYDEDLYALADIKGCVTKGKGGPQVIVDEKQPQKSSEGWKSTLSSKKCKISGLILLLVVAGGIAGLSVTILTGTKYLHFYMW